MALRFDTFKIDSDEKIYSKISNRFESDGLLELKLKLTHGHFAINLNGLENEIEGIIINNKKSPIDIFKIKIESTSDHDYLDEIKCICINEQSIRKYRGKLLHVVLTRPMAVPIINLFILNKSITYHNKIVIEKKIQENRHINNIISPVINTPDAEITDDFAEIESIGVINRNQSKIISQINSESIKIVEKQEKIIVPDPVKNIQVDEIVTPEKPTKNILEKPVELKQTPIVNSNKLKKSNRKKATSYKKFIDFGPIEKLDNYTKKLYNKTVKDYIDVMNDIN